MAWNSNQYLKFASERSIPCADLIAKLDKKYDSILDLGCGPGNSTRQLKNNFSNSEIVGFDADENMLKRAKKDNPNLEFLHGFAPNDFGKIDRKFDLIFSNACIHWIPEQEELIKGISSLLKTNGTLAVQIPLTEESQFYKVLYELIENKWSKLKHITNFHNLDQTGYYNLLFEYYNNIDIWETDYYHIVDSKQMIIEWYKGSGLKPYLDVLSLTEKENFLQDLEHKINEQYSTLNNGKLFLVMPRLFFIASK